MLLPLLLFLDNCLRCRVALYTQDIWLLCLLVQVGRISRPWHFYVCACLLRGSMSCGSGSGGESGRGRAWVLVNYNGRLTVLVDYNSSINCIIFIEQVHINPYNGHTNHCMTINVSQKRNTLCNCCRREYTYTWVRSVHYQYTWLRNSLAFVLRASLTLPALTVLCILHSACPHCCVHPSLCLPSLLRASLTLPALTVACIPHSACPHRAPDAQTVLSDGQDNVSILLFNSENE